jgi:hypothetical protein
MNDYRNSLSVLEEWYRKQDYKVFYSKSSAWVELAKGVYQAFPYHWIINPSEDEISHLFKENSAFALRYSTPLTNSYGQISYHVIYDKPDYPISDLPKKVKKGLKHCIYGPISMDRLAGDGWQARYDTLMRQGRQNAETKGFWEKLCRCAEGLPGFEAWGATLEGELIASLLAYSQDETVSILYQQSKTDHLRFGVNNALTYSFTHCVLERPAVRCIFYGLHSLDAPPGVDKYKFGMNYYARPVRQRVVFNPLIAPLIRPLSHTLLKLTLKIFPKNSKIAKAEGMVRFYLQGKRPLANQEWPDGLHDQRDMVFHLDRSI